MNRYLITARRVQMVEIMVCALDEDDAFDQAMKSKDWDIVETGIHEDVIVTDVTYDRDYQEEME